MRQRSEALLIQILKISPTQIGIYGAGDLPVEQLHDIGIDFFICAPMIWNYSHAAAAGHTTRGDRTGATKSAPVVDGAGRGRRKRQNHTYCTIRKSSVQDAFRRTFGGTRVWGVPFKLANWRIKLENQPAQTVPVVVTAPVGLFRCHRAYRHHMLHSPWSEQMDIRHEAHLWHSERMGDTS